MVLRTAQTESRTKRSPRSPGSVIDTLERRQLFTAITGLSLINTDTDSALAPFTNDTIINALKPGMAHVSVRADGDASTASVRFSVDGGDILDSSNPFTLGGENGADYLPFVFATGTHSLLVTPYGGTGGTGTVGKGFRVTFSVDQAGLRAPNILPTVNLVSPTTTTAIAPGFSLLRADASDIDGLVSKVEFWANGALLSTTTNAPYLASWRDVPAGSYSVTARAYDSDGGISDSAPATVTINAPSAFAKTVFVSPSGSDVVGNLGTTEAAPVKTIANAMALAAPGDTISLLPGTYFESLKIAKSNLTISAKTAGTVVIDGTMTGGTKQATLLIPDVTTPGLNLIVSGIVFRNAASGNRSDSAALRTADGWRISDCTVELTNGNAVGILGSNVTLLRVIAQNNGCSGIGGTSAKNAMMLDCISRGNNTNENDGTGEAGGGKFTRTQGFLVEGYNSYQNKGPGLWFDYNNINIVVRNSLLHDNITLPLNANIDKITGTGLFFEVSGAFDNGAGVESRNGPLLAENNTIYNNQGRGITIYASAYVTIANNLLSGNSLELKDGRDAPFSIHDLTITGNLFNNGRINADVKTVTNYAQRRYRIDSNVYDNDSGKLWSWAPGELNDFAPIRAMGFEIHGRRGTIDFTPPVLPLIADTPKSTAAPVSTPAPITVTTSSGSTAPTRQGFVPPRRILPPI